jgi:hypothetical protein
MIQRKIQFPSHIRTFRRRFHPSTIITIHPSIIIRFYHLPLSVLFSAIFIVFKPLSVFIVTVSAISTATSASVYRYHRRSKIINPAQKTCATPATTPRELIPATKILKDHICLVVVTTTSPAHIELAL